MSSRSSPLSEDGPRRIEITTVEPKPGIWEQEVWKAMVSHLRGLSLRGAPDGRIAAVLAGKLGPILVGCEVRYFLNNF